MERPCTKSFFIIFLAPRVRPWMDSPLAVVVTWGSSRPSHPHTVAPAGPLHLGADAPSPASWWGSDRDLSHWLQTIPLFYFSCWCAWYFDIQLFSCWSSKPTISIFGKEFSQKQNPSYGKICIQGAEGDDEKQVKVATVRKDNFAMFENFPLHISVGPKVGSSQHPGWLWWVDNLVTCSGGLTLQVDLLFICLLVAAVQEINAQKNN